VITEKSIKTFIAIDGIFVGHDGVSDGYVANTLNG